MDWRTVCELDYLKDVPCKVETNEWGQIVMTPASNWHGEYQLEIAAILRELGRGKGRAQVECGIETRKGVKVTDVAWSSNRFLETHDKDKPYTDAPEVCVEVISPSNHPDEIAQKRELYFELGAVEVWLCDKAGNMTFLDQGGLLEKNALFPAFPARVEF